MSLITLVPQGGQFAVNLVRRRVRVGFMQLPVKWGRGHRGSVLQMRGCSGIMPNPSFRKWGTLRLEDCK